MSRIGKAPISIPAGVSIDLDAGAVTVTGPKGSLSQPIPGALTVRQDDSELLVERPDDGRESRSLHGMFRSLVNNMVLGVTQGFRKDLDIVGVGYRAAARGDSALDLQLGFSHPVEVVAPEGIQFVVPQPTRIEIHGIDKQLVGQVAANIRSIRKPEPYKGKGVRYTTERVRRKAGKAGK
ncbi:MAG TPA: 50S ribosomal protein L6 [Acidimicrobiaceae bacterium]|jgi:large subunit ribosomal protein L6|nr:50S ribosomal protein L6 [Acidimicrobiaceae bacterium]